MVKKNGINLGKIEGKKYDPEEKKEILNKLISVIQESSNRQSYNFPNYRPNSEILYQPYQRQLTPEHHRYSA